MQVGKVNFVPQEANNQEALKDNQASYNITFSINRAYLLFCMVTLYSLLKNNPQYYFNIYILHNNCLKEEEINKITKQHPLNQYNNFKIHLVDVSSVYAMNNIGHNFKWTEEVFFKIFLPEILPQVDRVLSLDTDVMIRGDIKSFLDTEMSNYLYSGDEHPKDRVCAGVLLCNLKLAREIGTPSKILDFITKQREKYSNHSYNISEEYAINHLFKDKIINAKNIITLIGQPEVDSNKNIVHFVGVKPWNINRKIDNQYRFLYKEYFIYLGAFSKYKGFITLYGNYAIGGGYMVNSVLKRLKGFFCKYFFKMEKFQYIHKNLFMAFVRKSSNM